MENPLADIKDPLERVVFSPEKLQHNIKEIDLVRTVTNILGGIIAGILSCTSLEGLAVFVVLYAVTSLALLTRMELQPRSYCTYTALTFMFSSISQYAVSFLLFWTLSYAIVYIY
jgi:hypothetical protein